MKNLLLELFESCLSKNYREAENGASFAYELQGDRLEIWFEHSRGITDWLNNLHFAATPYRQRRCTARSPRTKAFTKRRVAV